jgi:hypothetical protein
MKKLVFALLVLISITKVANAQKGSTLLYGNLGFISNRTTSAGDTAYEKSYTYYFNPGYGYQFNDRWTVGLNIGVGGTKQELPPTGGTGNSGNYNTTTFFNIGPFLRYSYPLSNIFSIYGQAEVNYLSGKNSPFELVSTSYTGFGANLFPAIGANLKNGFALNFSFGGIVYQETTNKGALNSASQFAVTFGQGATFGISKNFGGKKK